VAALFRKLTRQQLAQFLKSPDLIRAFEALQDAVASSSTAGGGTVTNSGDLGVNEVLIGQGGADLRSLGDLGTAGQVLTSAGPGLPPAWVPGGSGPYIKGAAWDGGGPLAIILPAGANVVYTVAPVSGTIQSAIAIGTGGTLGSGSMTCEVWRKATGVPTSADKISASAPITLSLANSSIDTTLTGWTKTVTAGDRLAFSLLTSTILTWIGVYLTIG
jgi:hypothetical protein